MMPSRLCPRRYNAWILGLISMGLAAAPCSGAHENRSAAVDSVANRWLHNEVTAAAVSSAVGAQENRFFVRRATGNSWLATNPQHELEASWVGDGVTFRRGSDWWQLQLAAWGFADDLAVPDTAQVRVNDNQLARERGALLEWYRNGPLGFQQGFTISATPRASAARAGLAKPGLGKSWLWLPAISEGSASPAALVIALRQRGTLRAVSGDGVSLRVVDGTGHTALHYGRLVAFDARGRFLPAQMTVQQDLVRIEVDPRGAVLPIVIDPFVQNATLAPSDGAAGDLFGTSVAISGDTIVVGSWMADLPGGTDQGKAYVFERDPFFGTISQVAILTASDAQSGDQFGRAVDIDGNTIVVGAFLADVGSHADQGAVYVFEKPVAGWSSMTETAKLTASDGQAGDNLGRSVAISNDTVVAGAYKADIGANADQGAAYVFERPGLNWTSGTETAKLTASTGAAGDSFGVGVDIDGGTVVVGAYFADVGGNADQGAAYVFERPVGSWVSTTETAKLTASDGAASDRLGLGVAVAFDVVAAGAYRADVGGATDAGAVYIFVKPGSGWTDVTETAKLVASTPEADAWLGFGVALQGNTLVAGAPYLNAAGKPGAAYVFVKPASGWANSVETEKLVDTAAQADQLAGISVALDSGTIVVGAPNADDGGRTDQGLVFVFGLCGNGVVDPGEGCDPGLPGSVCCSGNCIAASPSDCPSGYSVFELPSTSLSRLRLGAAASVTGGSACLTGARLGEGASFQGDLYADLASTTKAGIRLGKNATVSGACVTAGAKVVLGTGASCLGGTDTTGMDPGLVACAGVSDAAETRRLALQALSPTLPISSPLRITSDQTMNLAGSGPVVVVDAPSVSISGGKTWTISGDSSTRAIIFRVAGKLSVGKLGKIQLLGIPPGPNGDPAERVLFLVGASARLGKQAIVKGTIVAQKAVAVGGGAQLEGAIASAKNVRVGAGATITHRPWALW